MPKLRWLSEAIRDVERLHAFVAEHSPDAAAQAARVILEAADYLKAHPEIGRPMGDDRREWFAQFGAGAYVFRYRIDATGAAVIIRVWHSREIRDG